MIFLEFYIDGAADNISGKCQLAAEGYVLGAGAHTL